MRSILYVTLGTVIWLLIFTLFGSLSHAQDECGIAVYEKYNHIPWSWAQVPTPPYSYVSTTQFPASAYPAGFNQAIDQAYVGIYIWNSASSAWIFKKQFSIHTSPGTVTVPVIYKGPYKATVGEWLFKSIEGDADGHLTIIQALYPNGCSDIPDCTELAGQQTQTTVDGKYPPGPFCVNNCQAEKVQDGVELYIVDGNKTFLDAQFTGQECTPSDVEPPDIPPTCEEIEDFCRGACGGELAEDFYCNSDTDFTCGTCEKPPFPLVDNPETGKVEPDQDKDGIGSGTDDDNDGDGIPNGDDQDGDGDGKHSKDDNDNDGDGIGNGGKPGWDPPRAGGQNGVGADPDIDGDGVPNGTSDQDIDGDGIPNWNDPDIDGDGVPNHLDSDADGDGILNGGDADADSDGLSGSDDSDPTGSSSSKADTDNDGEVGEEDSPVEENGEDLEEPGEGPGEATCPEGQVCPGDGVCQPGEPSTSADCAGDNYIQERFGQMKDNLMSSGLFSLVGGLGSLPSGGSSVYTVNFPETFGGPQTFDFADMNQIWNTLSIILTIGFAWIGIRIITLKR